MRSILIVITLVTIGFGSDLGAEPTYESDASRVIIVAMIAAHGGMERWSQAPAIRFDAVMHDNYAGKQQLAWWIAHEVIDQATRQVYQNWPMDDARLGFDGEKVWTENWRRANKPPFMVHFFYYFVNLPWLTQDDGVILGAPKRFRWPGLDREFHEIKMSFESDPTIGKTDRDYYVLYIDPESHRLVGYQYANGYRPQLEVMGIGPQREVFGPLWRLITRYSEVDGLVFPSAFRTMPEPDERIVGNHVILNIDVSTPFEAQKAAVPAGAEVHEP